MSSDDIVTRLNEHVRIERQIAEAEYRRYEAEIDRLRVSLTALVVAAGRMLDGWAEGDAAYRRQLWQALHTAADDADERHGIYPL